MTWEDDELAGYEERRITAKQRDMLSVQRNSLLEGRHNQEWLALRTGVQTRLELLNQRAGREITKSLTPRVPELRIRREDGVELKAEYIPATRTVTFSCEALPFGEKSYELTVCMIEGNDTVAWRAIQKNPEIVSRENIVKEVVTSFLHAGTLL